MSSIHDAAEPAGLSLEPQTAAAGRSRGDVEIPYYVSAHYWWAYVHPWAVRLFERPWLTNLILWGNYARLRDAALADMGEILPGRTLQVACVYGDLSYRVHARAAAGGGSLDVIDVLQIQLDNLRRKLPAQASARLLCMDSTQLSLPAARYDRALVFFLLHEQPDHAREGTMREVFRVVKPGGRIVIVDYAKPRVWHPLRYLWRPVLAALEPFALDLWGWEIANWLPIGAATGTSRKDSFFGGLYQKVVFIR
jgi:ubiquinone/menaquinone biosynthesis C-methylase UbiE